MRFAPCLLLPLLCMAMTACEQEKPPEPPAPPAAPIPAETGWRKPLRDVPSVFSGYTSADSALADFESILDTDTRLTTRPVQPLIAYGDSARHYQRTLTVVERFSRERPLDTVMVGLLLALRDMGARRPFFRSLVRDARQNPALARAAVVALSTDPNEAELREMEAFDEGMDRDHQLNHTLSQYLKQLRFWTR